MMIRFSTDEVFETDSQEYEILYNAVKKVGTATGSVVEIGTRRGGSMKIIIDALVETGNVGRNLIAIDPYGNITIDCTNLNMSIHNPDRVIEGDKMSKDLVSPQRFDYNNSMRNRVIPSLYYYAYQAGMNFNFFTMTDSQFIKRFADGVPMYDEEEIVVNDYSFVFFDGPHDNAALDLECGFFIPRMSVGSTVVFDDVWMYDHDGIVEQKWLFANGFETLERGKIKASYQKVR
jgi:hypothetical protein